MANDEAQRGGQFIQYLDRVGFQALCVHAIHHHPQELLEDILCEKIVDLMTAIITFLSSSLLYFKHGFFGTFA